MCVCVCVWIEWTKISGRMSVLVSLLQLHVAYVAARFHGIALLFHECACVCVCQDSFLKKNVHSKSVNDGLNGAKSNKMRYISPFCN